MRNKPLPGLMKNSPLHNGTKTKGKLKTTIGVKLKKTKHPVTPPTVEQSKASKGKIREAGKRGLFGIEGPKKGYGWDGQKH